MGLAAAEQRDGGRAHEHPALEGFFGITPEILKRFESASAIAT